MRASRMPGDAERTAPPARVRIAWLAALFGCCCLAGSGEAEVYRCEDPAGGVTFTDDASACAGARRHAVQARIQTVSNGADDSPATPPAVVETAPRATNPARQAEKEQWEQRKLRKQAELDLLTRQIARLERFVTGCNRGLEITGRDDTGIKVRLSCDEIRQEYADAERHSRELAAYLETGLEEDCRRSGCLPGWIR